MKNAPSRRSRQLIQWDAWRYTTRPRAHTEVGHAGRRAPPHTRRARVRGHERWSMCSMGARALIGNAPIHAGEERNVRAVAVGVGVKGACPYGRGGHWPMRYHFFPRVRRPLERMLDDDVCREALRAAAAAYIASATRRGATADSITSAGGSTTGAPAGDDDGSVVVPKASPSGSADEADMASSSLAYKSSRLSVLASILCAADSDIFTASSISATRASYAVDEGSRESSSRAMQSMLDCRRSRQLISSARSTNSGGRAPTLRTMKGGITFSITSSINRPQ